MSTTLLDKHPGSREYVAQLKVYGATRREIAEKLAAKFDLVAVPTTRSISNYFADDEELRRMVRELSAIRDEIGDDATGQAELPEPRNKAQDDSDMFTLMDEHPAFAELVCRDDDDDPQASGASGWGAPTPSAPAADAKMDPDVFAVLAAGHETDEAFEADALGRLTDAERGSIAHMLVPA